MSNINYLDGYIYHMVHFDNLKNIFQRRALLSKERVLQEKIPYRSIAFETVQNLRDRIYIWDSSIQRPRSLHSYVPFYFATLTPMLYVQFSHGVQDETVIFEVSRTLIKEQGVLFTDGNASNQQFSKYGGERVLITPATSSNSSCHRRYFSGQPQGTNPNLSNFYADPAFLERLNWNVINDRWFNEDEKKRIKHAEVLVPDLLPLSRIHGILVNKPKMVVVANALIDESGLTGRIPSALCRPSLFFY